jgi:hypothetical protein
MLDDDCQELVGRSRLLTLHRREYEAVNEAAGIFWTGDTPKEEIVFKPIVSRD